MSLCYNPGGFPFILKYVKSPFQFFPFLVNTLFLMLLIDQWLSEKKVHQGKYLRPCLFSSVFILPWCWLAVHLTVSHLDYSFLQGSEGLGRVCWFLCRKLLCSHSILCSLLTLPCASRSEAPFLVFQPFKINKWNLVWLCFLYRNMIWNGNVPPGTLATVPNTCPKKKILNERNQLGVILRNKADT